jgi:hypothetical protein
VIGCCCPVCGDLSLQRQRMKRLLMQLEREHPGVKASLLKALGNVMPRHLLDRRLNPPPVGVSEASTGPGAPETPQPCLPEDEVDGGGDANPSGERHAGPPARVIPLIVQHPVRGVAVRTGRQERATPGAVPEAHACETGIRAAE